MTEKPKKDRIVTIRITLDLDLKTAAAAEKLHLKKPDVMRLSMERGLDILIAQLSNDPTVSV